MKKYIKLIVIVFSLFIRFEFVNAENINDLKRDEIVIGNTKFSSDTWVSASRAAKAGSLYTSVNGKTDVNTYLYVNPYIIYIYDLSIENYRLLSSDEIKNLEIDMNIYFLNNEPLDYTYTRDESLEEDFHFNWFFSNYDLMEINDSSIKVDQETESITCKFGQNFEIEIDYCEDESCLSGEVEKYIGKCGYDYKFTTEYKSGNNPINLKEVIETEHNNYLNQDKVEIEESDFVNLPGVELNITEKLEYFDFGNNNYDNGDYYYALDLIFDEKNDALNYDIFTDYYFERDYNVESNIIRLLIPLNMYVQFDMFEFAILDNEHNSFEKFNVYVNGLEKIQTDFDILDVKSSDEYINLNTSSIKELIYEDNDVDIYLNKNLNKLVHNDIEARWVSFDMEIDGVFKLEHLDVYSYDESLYDEGFDYEIIDNKLRLWINVDSLDSNYLNIQFYYNLTYGRPFKTLSFEFINESDELSYEWGLERDSAGRKYLYVIDALGNIVDGIVNITYTNTNVSKQVVVYEDGYLFVPELVTINSVAKFEEGEY